jgi:O-antigen/teichoic acid export membrane protein
VDSESHPIEETPVAAAQPKFSSGIIALVGSAAFSVVVGFLLNIIIGRVFGPEGRGAYGIIGSFWPLAMTIGIVGIPIACSQLIATNRDKALPVVQNAFTAILFTMVVSAAVLPIVASTRLSEAFHDLPPGAFWLTAVSLPMMMFNTFLEYVLRGMQDFKKVGKATMIWRSATLILVFCSFLFFRKAILPMLFSTVIAEGIRSIYLLRSCHEKFGWKMLVPAFDPKLLKLVGTQGLGFYVGAVSAIFNYKADQIILGSYSNDHNRAVGIYGMAVTAAELLNVLNAGLAQALMPRIASMTDEDQRTALTAKACRQSILTGFIAALFIGGTAPILIPLALGPAFRPSVPLLGLLLPAVFVLGLHRIISSDFAGRGRPWVASIANVLTMIVTGTLYFILIPQSGAYGASLATLIGYSFVAVLIIGYFMKNYHVRLVDLLIPQKEDIQALKRKVVGKLAR